MFLWILSRILIQGRKASSPIEDGLSATSAWQHVILRNHVEALSSCRRLKPQTVRRQKHRHPTFTSFISYCISWAWTKRIRRAKNISKTLQQGSSLRPQVPQSLLAGIHMLFTSSRRFHAAAWLTRAYWIILHTKTGSLPGFWANYELSPNTAGTGEHCIKTKSPRQTLAHSGGLANHGRIACIVAWQVYVYTNILDDRTSYCPEHMSHWNNHSHHRGSSLSRGSNAAAWLTWLTCKYWRILCTKTGNLPSFWANHKLSPSMARAGEHCIRTHANHCRIGWKTNLYWHPGWQDLQFFWMCAFHFPTNKHVPGTNWSLERSKGQRQQQHLLDVCQPKIEEIPSSTPRSG